MSDLDRYEISFPSPVSKEDENIIRVLVNMGAWLRDGFPQVTGHVIYDVTVPRLVVELLSAKTLEGK